MTDSCVIDIEVDEHIELIAQKIVVARKDHICGECRGIILRGRSYENYTGTTGSDLVYAKTCLDCLSVRETYFCSYYFSQIWEDFWEKLYEDEECVISMLHKITAKARNMAISMVEDRWEDGREIDE